ncbi:N-6 DNA methylase [Solihabitans fulvus]|uniref:N-6 DNA methylase n=1 Tax=Solihabitans fulvus TaxID=1892852 RepID=A0A5B2XUP9_9PSEU|nr:N-6 DNA methylase [Solihabitans fulvus]KAA2267033.1 N-6 DNA methylase [Solihabitans fulvus]
MSQDTTVTAADIARLGDVGRAAVSNWRRRHEDFPEPVGGTASSPLFSLREVESWLRRNGKAFEVSLADRAWQQLRASGEDLRLGELVAGAGALLARLAGREPPGHDGLALTDPALIGLITDLAAERGSLDAFEFLCERYQEAHSRRLSGTPADIAALLARLACQDGGTVLDPACGLGTLLLAAPAARALGQETAPSAALIAAVRLGLREVPAAFVVADSLRHNGFPGELVDAVLCDPPLHDRAWGYDELTADPRWEHGLPPRGEPELAWLQHCLAHARPGGLVAILMPQAAASRRPGRRIRANLLRSGTLRAVVTLTDGGPDLWLLRRPLPGEPPPAHLLTMEADGDLAAVETAWRQHLREPAAEPPAPGRAVRVIDLLDEDVDLSPACHGGRHPGRDLGAEFAATLDRLRAAALPLPDLAVLAEPRTPPTTTIGELARAGLLTIAHAPTRLRTDGGDLPVLLADDLATGSAPSGRTEHQPGLVTLARGDVVAAPTGAARVVDTDGAVLGPYLARYRVDQERLDPDFLAGVLRSADPRAYPGSSRMDARRTQLPRLSLAEQRAYGRAFRQLAALADAVRDAAELGEKLVGLGFAGLVDGHLRPNT